MKPVMYIFANKGLEMSPGKLSAQVAHAAVEAYNLSSQQRIDAWYKGGHHTKLVLEARDTEHLLNIERYLQTRGFKTALIIDEGRTEIAPHSPTALGVAIVDKDDQHTALTFGDFKTYREPPRDPGIEREEDKRFPYLGQLQFLLGGFTVLGVLILEHWLS